MLPKMKPAPKIYREALSDDYGSRTDVGGAGLVSRLGHEPQFGSSHAQLTELVPSVARLALECIGNSDALYHNVEHTMLVTLAGHDIMKGRALLVPTLPSDYAHLIVACLMHTTSARPGHS